MKTAKILIYDGSFNGFLTAIYKAFDEKIIIADIQKNTSAQRGLFSDTETVFTEMEKAKRVWNGVQKKSNTSIKNVYFAFQSESKGIELLLYRYIRKLFTSDSLLHLNFRDDSLSRIGNLANIVAREKQRTEALLDFQLSQDNIFFATIEPEFDVLPLVSKHFRSRFADKLWLIFDAKRKYGLFYNLKSVELISLDLNALPDNSRFSREEHIQRARLNAYFKNTRIESLINPKVFTHSNRDSTWKFATEKKAV